MRCSARTAPAKVDADQPPVGRAEARRGHHRDRRPRRTPRLTPREARRAGIAVVQQELSLSPHLSIAENIGLGAMPRRFGLIDYRRACRRRRPPSASGRARRAARSAGRGAAARPAADGGDRQGAVPPPKVLILDEPTSSLSAHEVRTLFDLLRGLRAQGLAILYISHRLNEVLALCEYVTVLKDGIRTADQPLAGIDPQALVRLMVGRDPGDLFPRLAANGARRRSPLGGHATCGAAMCTASISRSGAARSSASAGWSARARRICCSASTAPSTRRPIASSWPTAGPGLPRSSRPTRAASPMCRPTASARGCCCHSRSAST